MSVNVLDEPVVAGCEEEEEDAEDGAEEEDDEAGVVLFRSAMASHWQGRRRGARRRLCASDVQDEWTRTPKNKAAASDVTAKGSLVSGCELTVADSQLAAEQ